MAKSEEESAEYGVNQFDRNGFAFCPIISQSEARKILEQMQKEYSHSGCLRVQGNDRFKIHLFLSEVNRIVHHPTLLEAVRECLKTPYIALWSSDLNIKQPNSREYFSAHQDSTYTGLQPADQCLTVWLALSDPVGLQEGCLSFLKGSHKRGQLPHVEEFNANTCSNGTNLLSRGQRVVYGSNENHERDDWVEIPLRAGQATLHHFHTIHQSGHNQNPTQPRIGLALRYMSLSVRQTGPVRECITWIDNTNIDPEENEQKRQELERFFDLEPQLPANPREEDLARGRQAHEEAMHREASNYFQDSTNVKAYDK